MNLDKEINEFYKTFKESALLGKILIVLGFFFSFSSLTSLSTKVVEWKGFILEGLSFYHFYFVTPISNFSELVGLSYTALEIHKATISSICVAVGMRIQILGQKIAFTNINNRYGSNVKPNLMVYWLIGTFAPVGIWLWYGIGNPNISSWWVIFSCAFLPIFITLPKTIMSKFGFEFFEKNDFSYFKSYYMYLVALLLLICIFAAINLGLNSK